MNIFVTAQAGPKHHSERGAVQSVFSAYENKDYRYDDQCVTLCSGERVVVGPPQFGRIEVSAFSALGERLPAPDIDLVQIGTHNSLKSWFKGTVAAKIPYGTYELLVSASGFRRSRREISSDQPAVLVRTQLSVGGECVGFSQIQGSVSAAPADHELWVKLVPLQGIGGAEARVNRDGSFLARGLDDGQYLLLVVDGKAIIHAANLVAPRGSPVNVDLAKN